MQLDTLDLPIAVLIPTEFFPELLQRPGYGLPVAFIPGIILKVLYDLILIDRLIFRRISLNDLKYRILDPVMFYHICTPFSHVHVCTHLST